jgi:hypothetical protein
MFGIYFGKYLQNKGIITPAQYDEIILENKTARVKMGLLAIEAGLMTVDQADEVNQLQTVMDRRFGDIAVEKGYISNSQVEQLLKKQGDSYLLFVQSLTERDILSLEEIQKELNAYKKSERFTALDLDAIKSSDIDKIVPVFTKDPSLSPLVKDYIALTARNLVRFIDSHVRMEKVERVNEYTGHYISSQELEGEFKLFTGFSGDGTGIKMVAEAYAGELFDRIDEDVLDAACEFLNCNNGLYATKLSQEDIELDMLPPMMYDKTTTIHSEGSMFRIPFYVSGKSLDMIICVESKWMIS